MERIDTEARRNASSSVDIDFFRSRNLLLDMQTGIRVISPSFEVYAYEKNLFMLLSNSDVKEFDPSWTMRPDYASFDIYGSTVFWHLIMFINNIDCFEQFKDMDEIYAPKYNDILKVIEDKVPRREISLINPFYDISNRGMIGVYDKKPMDDNELNKIRADDNLGNMTDPALPEVPLIPEYQIIETQDVFVLAQQDLDNMYVDISSIPINVSTLELRLDNYSITQKYGYDYMLKQNGSGDLKRISWNPIDCVTSGGMLEVMYIDTVVTVKYLAEELIA
jgi:hypothetical protein